MASEDGEAKQQMWEEFGEAMEDDFTKAPRFFWKHISHIRRGKQGNTQAVYSKDGTLLTLTENVIGCWKRHFKEFLYLNNPL